MIELIFAIQLITAPCVEHDVWVDYLKESYKELLILQTIARTGNLFEIFMSENGETWTILITKPGELTCAISSGRNMRLINPDWMVLVPKT